MVRPVDATAARAEGLPLSWPLNVSRQLIGAATLVWIGSTLLLSQWRRTSRPSLEERLRPFSPGSAGTPRTAGFLSVESVRDLIVPLTRAAGDRIASLFGVSEPVATRLRRVHSSLDPAGFRLRQMAWAGACLLVAAVTVGALDLPTALAILLLAGCPLLAFLFIEQRLAWTSERWQRDLLYEVPVVSEQLAMLLNAGYSLGAALSRVASHGHGSVAADLAVVTNRVRQGLSETDALREWGDLAKVEAVDRLVAVLTLHSDAVDLGRLVSAEARQARRDLQRRKVEAIERRAQQVWIPVTVATLVPGAILLAVPFLSALRLFSNA
jgi:Flp pilus assembly protein TadB